MMKRRKSFSFWIGIATILATFAIGNRIAFSKQIPASSDKVELFLSQAGSHDVEIRDLGVGSYEIQATGPHPMAVVAINGAVSPLRTHVLAFEYFSASSTDHVRVRYGASEE